MPRKKNAKPQKLELPLYGKTDNYKEWTKNKKNNLKKHLHILFNSSSSLKKRQGKFSLNMLI